MKEAGGIAKITTKYTTQGKETKIIVNSPWVKERVLFKDNSIIKKDKEYRRMLNFLCGYTMAGKINMTMFLMLGQCLLSMSSN